MTAIRKWTHWTPKKRAKFLEVLREGGSANAAANAVGMSRSSAYELRSIDSEFSKLWEEAIDCGTDVLEDEAKRRAAHGVDEPVFYQGAQCGLIRKYSDTLLIFMLKARRPQKFRDNVSQDDSPGALNPQLKALADALRAGPLRVNENA